MSFVLSTSRSEDVEVATEAQIRSALKSLQDGELEFAILATAPEFYIQAARDGDAFVLEKRSGSAETHQVGSLASNEALTFDVVEAAFLSFYHQRPMPISIRWAKHEEMSSGCIATVILVLAFPAIAGALSVGSIVHYLG